MKRSPVISGGLIGGGIALAGFFGAVLPIQTALEPKPVQEYEPRIATAAEIDATLSLSALQAEEIDVHAFDVGNDEYIMSFSPTPELRCLALSSPSDVMYRECALSSWPVVMIISVADILFDEQLRDAAIEAEATEVMISTTGDGLAVWLLTPTTVSR